MFIETRVDTMDGSQIVRTFIKSLNIQAFPCGRRRSTQVEKDTVAESESYRIPFDPEARLNTEANNRKHTSLNGYTQTYLKSWNKDNDGKLLLSLAGYLFSIYLVDGYTTSTDFGTKVIDSLKAKLNSKIADASTTEEDEAKLRLELEKINAATSIYANIRIEDFKLFSGFSEYYTGVLHGQSTEANDSDPVLDILRTNGDQESVDDYYFSGLSFSVTPLTGKTGTRSEYSNEGQTTISLCILDKKDPEWLIHEPAYLPKIEHGDVEDSVVISHLSLSSLEADDATIKNKLDVTASGDIELTSNGSGATGSIKAEKFVQNGKPVPAINLVQGSGDDEGYWQLQINIGTI